MTRLPAAATALTFVMLCTIGSTATDAASPAGERRTVLVELFTSQGCSSCPAADRLLTELVAEGSDGVDIVALSYHVDYWNYIGWTDPFSSADWSARQRSYSRELAGGRTYTPQLVVDGVSEGVGSDRREVRRQIAQAATRPASAELAVSLAADGRLDLAAALPVAGTPAEVRVAVYETALTTEVKRGENARRTLVNDNVVRSLTTVAQLAPGQTWRGEHAFALDPSWRRDRLGVAVFVQSTGTLEILAATANSLATAER